MIISPSGVLFLWQPSKAPQPFKMALIKPEKAFCILEFARSESAVIVQKAFRVKYHKDPPVYNRIKKWYSKFEEDDCLCDVKRSGRPGLTEEKVEQVRKAF